MLFVYSVCLSFVLAILLLVDANRMGTLCGKASHLFICVVKQIVKLSFLSLDKQMVFLVVFFFCLFVFCPLYNICKVTV